MRKLLTKKQFRSVYTKVPRLCVDLIILRGKKVLLSKRSIYPQKGWWHFPGGTVLYKEPIKEAINRVAENELGVKVTSKKFLGYMEFPKDGYRHSISLAFECRISGNQKPMPLSQSSELKMFGKVPKKTVREQKEFLKKHFTLT